jgi:hypothetical protein
MISKATPQEGNNVEGVVISPPITGERFSLGESKHNRKQPNNTSKKVRDT